MITGVRIALLCDHVEEDERGLSVIGVWDHQVVAGNRPGAVEVQLLLQVELDSSPSVGQVRVQAGDYDEAFPFDVKTDRPLTAMLFQLLLPALERGEISVSVVDLAQPQPWTFTWALDFMADAKPLGVPPAEIIAACRAAAADLRALLGGEAAVTVQ